MVLSLCKENSNGDDATQQRMNFIRVLCGFLFYRT